MLTRNKTQLSIVAVGALLVIDFVWFGFLPSRKQLELIRKLEARQLGVVDVAETQRGQVVAVRQELEQLERDMGELGRHIPKEKSIGTFLTEMSILMTRHGLTKQMIIPRTETAGDIAIRVPVAVHCEGKLKAIYGFYEDLKGIERLVRIDEMLLTNDAHLAGHLRMEAQFIIFYQPDPIWEADRRVSAL